MVLVPVGLRAFSWPGSWAGPGADSSAEEAELQVEERKAESGKAPELPGASKPAVSESPQLWGSPRTRASGGPPEVAAVLPPPTLAPLRQPLLRIP